MAAREFLQLVLLPPGSVEAEIGKLQNAIFSTHGLASAAALPAMIPIASLPVDWRTRGLLARVDASAPAPYRIVTTVLAWVNGCLFLSVDSGGTWRRLREEAISGMSEPGQGLMPAHEGFFLGCMEADADERGAIRPVPPSVGFSSSALALVRIEAPGNEEWWQEVYCEVVEEKPLRGRRP